MKKSSSPGFYNKYWRKNTYIQKRVLLQHPQTVEAGLLEGPDMVGFGIILNIRTLYIKSRSFLHCKWKSIKGLLVRIGCTFKSGWHYLKHSCICTTRQMLKINHVYTLIEVGDIDRNDVFI
jgi:hypothetical protein